MVCVVEDMLSPPLVVVIASNDSNINMLNGGPLAGGEGCELLESSDLGEDERVVGEKEPYAFCIVRFTDFEELNWDAALFDFLLREVLLLALEEGVDDGTRMLHCIGKDSQLDLHWKLR